MRFPPDFIERLKYHLPLSQVIGKRIAVRKFGREYKALCPFHGEKTPSFTISDEKGFFHCFGCGVHGDAIGFIKDYERLSYVEAVERLATEAGLPLPAVAPQEEERYRKALTLFDALEEAASWFQKQFTVPEAAEARDYLASRNVAPEMIAQFRIGFSPAGREALKSHLMKKGFSESALLEAGILAQAEDGKTYDRFRSRIIFPICDQRGRVVAFGGRILPSLSEQVRAKYLNSPETPLFHKGEMLYGMHHARRHIQDRQSAVLAEGYLDVIALYQAGFTHAVAPLGTAVTAQQLQLLWRICPEIVMCLDGDAAGRRAMTRAAETAFPLLQAGNALAFALLPEGEDPDSLIMKRGQSAMQTVLDKKSSLSEILWHSYSAQIGTTTPEQRARLESTLMQTADKIGDPVLRQHFREYFRQQLWSLGKGGKKGGRKNALMSQKANSTLLLAALRPGGVRSRFEEQLFCLLMHHPFLLQQADIEEEFARLELSDNRLDKLREAILEHQNSTEAISRESLVRFLASSGFSDLSDHIGKQAALLVPSFLHDTDVNIHEAALVWRQVISAYRQNVDASNDNAPLDEATWERLRERVTMHERKRAHFDSHDE